MKELLPNEWEEYANTHGVGDIASGKITNVTDFGIFVELAPGVEGLCHISEIDRDEGLALAEMYSAGHAVRCRILRVDWHKAASVCPCMRSNRTGSRRTRPSSLHEP